MNAKSRGFTVLEMMVVVSISLALMLLIVPIFQITTRTVKTVERKLALYEAARNILDLIAFELVQGALNERGEHFSIKNIVYTDTDPFTDPGNTALATDRYGRTSRREADLVNFMKLQGGGFRFAQNLSMPGSMAYPLCYPDIIYRYPEAWKCSLRTSLTYWDFGSYAGDEPIPSWTRPVQLNDVALINMQIVEHTHTSEHRWFADSSHAYDAIPNSLAPGYEIKKVVNYPDDPAKETLGMDPEEDLMRSRARHLGGIRIIDLDVAYWDDLDKRFKDLPDDTALYFWPAPKAIRVTISVCDLEKRGMLSLARVVQLPVGLGVCGDKAVNASAGDLILNPKASSDSVRLDLDAQPFNRTKAMGIASNEVGLLGK